MERSCVMVVRIDASRGLLAMVVHGVIWSGVEVVILALSDAELSPRSSRNSPTDGEGCFGGNIFIGGGCDDVCLWIEVVYDAKVETDRIADGDL